MHPSIESVFNEAENRYLNSEELGVVSEYVQSIPNRLEIYRLLRDQEVNILQPVVDNVQKQFPSSETKRVERTTKNGILALRACAMAMLLNDETYVQERVQWLRQTQKNNALEDIDRLFYEELEKQLQQTLGGAGMKLIQGVFDQIRSALMGEESPPPANVLVEEEDELNLSSLF